MRLRNILILAVILAIAALSFFLTRPEPEAPPVEERPEYVWYLEMEDLTHITIELPHLDLSQSFVKHEDRRFYFDEPDGPVADPQRWGGIDLILSGPTAERPIAKNADEEKLAIYGFNAPLMRISLTVEDGHVLIIEVGDEVPDGHAYYVRVAESTDIYLVDALWYQVLERIVMEPPYPPEDE